MSADGSNMHSGKMATLSKPPYFTVQKVMSDVFQPNMPPATFAVYAVLARRDNLTANPNNSLRELAKAANVSTATASRSVEILVDLGLIERSKRSGSKANEYKLGDSLQAASKCGAKYNKRTVSYSLSPEDTKRLRGRVKAVEAKQRSAGSVSTTAHGVSPEIRQRFPEREQRTRRETQTVSPLIQEEGSNEEVPTPTPSQNDGAGENAKDLPDEDEPEPSVKWARAQFIGVMNDLGDALFDTSRPPAPHLTNGAEDWTRFGFNNLGIEAVARDGDQLVLTIRADDTEAAQRGIQKYRRRWEAACFKWFGASVILKWVKVERRW